MNGSGQAHGWYVRVLLKHTAIGYASIQQSHLLTDMTVSSSMPFVRAALDENNLRPIPTTNCSDFRFPAAAVRDDAAPHQILQV